MSRRIVVWLVAVVVAGAVVVGLLGHRSNTSSPEVTPEQAAAPSGGSGPSPPAPARPGVVSARARDRDERAAVGSLEEAQLMARLRQLAEHDPQRAVAVAREGNRRFPDSPYAPERTSILIH